MIEFTNPRVARHFKATVDKDRIVHVPGIYSGPLSGIGVAAARKMFADEDNQLEKIDETPVEEMEADPEE